MTVTDLTQTERQNFYEMGFYYGSAAIIYARPNVDNNFEKQASKIFKGFGGDNGTEVTYFFALGYKDGQAYGKGFVTRCQEIPVKDLNAFIEKEFSEVNPFKGRNH